MQRLAAERHVVGARRAAARFLLLASAVSLSACDDAGTLGSLSPRELFGATSLTAAERKEQIRSLNWRLNAIADLAATRNKQKPDAEQIEEICTCVVDNLQDRTTRLQFSMAMDTIKRGDIKALPDLSAYRSLAMAKGMSKEDFATQPRELARHLNATFENCLGRFIKL